MKQIMLICYAAAAVGVFGILGFVIWWPLAVYVYHYWWG